ncbi:MAG TPA: hypothetical protein VF713_24675 [Thermoanaerobaculia bacterium]
MPTELKIRWQGDARGLPEKRLSLSAFGEPLNLLLKALRRIATNLATDASEDKKVGRLANAARQLDIEIFDLVRESSGFDGVITLGAPALGENLVLFENLAQSAGLRLLEAIDDERNGIARNAGVRNYLESLPPGITFQSYVLHDNGKAIGDVSFGEMTITSLPPDLPHIAHYVGKIIGVGFEPGKPEVRVKTANATVSLSASADHVEKALDLRGSEIIAVAVVQGSSHRLLIIQDSQSPINTSTRDVVVFDRWNGILRRLAQ